MEHLIDPHRKQGNLRMTPVTQRPIEVGEARAALDAHPELWNQNTLRKQSYVHTPVDDIWLRYRDIKDLKHRTAQQFVEQEHECVWYPAWQSLREPLIPLVFGLANAMLATRIGGILITRIPAGHRVEAHKDLGHNARHYRKFCISLAANHRQAFCFAGESMLTEDGEVFEFDNLFEHSVQNDSDEPRISLIVSLRTE